MRVFCWQTNMDTLFTNYKQKLAEFLKFQSISADPKHENQMQAAADWLKNLLQDGGFKSEIWTDDGANPVVFGSFIKSPNLQTVLIYGHYDVQPAEKEDGWQYEPFELSEDAKKFYGRGVVDNKGQVLIHIMAAIAAIKSGNLNYNIKFLIEGNEESGSGELYEIIKHKASDIACDFVLISDGELTNGKPTIEVSLRGGFSCTLKYKTGKTNLHSGTFGGAVPNAGKELSEFLSKLFNSDNSISFKEFYDDVDQIHADDLNNNLKLTKESEDIAKLAGVKSLLQQQGHDFYTATGNIPTIQITGIKVGHIGRGYANIVPAEAEVKLNFRIVTSQNSKVVAEKFKKFVEQNTPSYVDFSLDCNAFHEPIKIDSESPNVKKVEQVLQKVYATHVNRKFVGGAIPVVVDFKNAFNIDSILVPLCNEDCNMHGVDENFDIELIKKGLEFSMEFLTVDTKNSIK